MSQNHDVGTIQVGKTHQIGTVQVGATHAIGGVVLPVANDPWTPADITTWAWWDPSVGSDVTLSSGKITAVADKSGNSRDLSVFGNDASNYLELADFGNGENAIDRTGTAAGLSLAGAGPSSCWFFTVLQSPSDTTYLIFSQESAGSPLFGIAQDGSASSPHASSGAPAYWSTGEAITPTTRDALHAAWEGAAGNVAAASGLNLSAYPNLAPHFYVTSSFILEPGLWGESLIVESSEVTTEVRQKIEGYLAHKYGFEANLPSGHPHKASAP